MGASGPKARSGGPGAPRCYTVGDRGAQGVARSSRAAGAGRGRRPDERRAPFRAFFWSAAAAVMNWRYAARPLAPGAFPGQCSPNSENFEASPHARDPHSSDRRPGGPQARGGRPAEAGQGRGPASPPRDRGQLYRHLSSHRLLSRSGPALHAGQRGRGRGRRGRAGRQGLQARRPGRLCRLARLLRRGAQHRDAVPRQAAARHFLRHGRRDDAEGAHGAVSFAPDLSGQGGRHDSRPGGGGRRRPHSLPVGQGARRDGDRHGRLAGKGQARQEGGRASHDPLPRGGFRQAGRGDHQGREMRGRLRRRRQGDVSRLARLPQAVRHVRELRLGLGRDRGVRHRPARRARARCSRPGRRCSPSWPTGRGSRRWRATFSGRSATAT